MKIYNSPYIYTASSNNRKIFQDKLKETTCPIQNKNYELPNYNQIAFTAARVDKGIERFFDVNKNRMPITAYRYVKSLVMPERFSPLELQKMAFARLNEATSVEDIQRFFPQTEEPLFSTLINPEKTKATIGILKCYRENFELLKTCNQEILNNQENLTVYLVKKIFLEGKTIKEINKDFEKDINKEFLALYKDKNPGSKQLIFPSTLKSLGIQMPNKAYLQSLKYTREGYSNSTGHKISKGLRDFWTSLSPEERTARAKKFVEKLETWWEKLSYQNKLDMLADEELQLKMLNSFKQVSAKDRTTASAKPVKEKTSATKKFHTKVGSEKLNQDDLFIRWTTNNLKIFEAGLSEAEKKDLEFRRLSIMANRWLEMTPIERTAYIQRMKTGSEPAKYAMIDAWNNSKELILELSKYLKENQIFKPHDMLYSDKAFSELQSNLMKEFWEQNRELANEFGKQIRLSQQKIKDAISHGTFTALKKRIESDRSRRINEIVALKTEKPKQNIPTEPKKTEIQEVKSEAAKTPVKTYKEEFIEAFSASFFGSLRSLPDSYKKNYPKAILNTLDENTIRLWTRRLKGEKLTIQETENLLKKIQVESFEIAKMNRALESALADTISRICENEKAYELSTSDLKTIMKHIENGDEQIQILSWLNNGKAYEFTVNKSEKINRKQINNLYEQYYKDLSEEETNKIVKDYFRISNTEEGKQIEKALKEYISTYGRSILILFSDKSKYPIEAKNSLNNKFLLGIPKELKNSGDFEPLLKNIFHIRKEEQLNKYKYMFGKKYDFLPQSFIDLYFDKIKSIFRTSDLKQLDAICTKRTNVQDRNRVVLIRHYFTKDQGADEILAMEQTLADILYKATGDERVYNLELEILMDKLELYNLCKHFPCQQPTPCKMTSGEIFYIDAKKKPVFTMLKMNYERYLKDIKAYKAELNGKEPDNYNEILYILNPENGKNMIDLYTGLRMASFGLKTNVGKVSITPTKK